MKPRSKSRSRRSGKAVFLAKPDTLGQLRLEELSGTEIEAVWAEEAERRLDELERGQVKEVPANEVLRRARAAIS